jgi:FtsZ-binding cell division protein ZapB
MGSGASVANADRESCGHFGDRVEVTKSLPVESFGQDNTTSGHTRSGHVGEKTLSSGSLSEEKLRERSTSKLSKSRKSLGSFLGFNTKLKAEEWEKASNEANSCSAEVAEFKIARLTKKNNELQQEKERLKRELESLRKSNSKWQYESQKAKDYERQAKERAKAFEDGKY